jgi:hypothetical protein
MEYAHRNIGLPRLIGGVGLRIGSAFKARVSTEIPKISRKPLILKAICLISSVMILLPPL